MRGLFVVEFRLPMDGPSVLLSHQSDDGHAVSVFHDPESGPSILFRHHGQMRRHRIDGHLPADLAGVARLSLWLDAGVGVWRMRYQVLDRSEAFEARGAEALAYEVPLIQSLSDRMQGGFRHPSVLWFGLTLMPDLPKSAPWIGQNTPIETALGPIPAGQLTPGLGIRTLDHGFQPLRALTRMSLPAAGSFAPVVLRRPFFAAERDLLVSSDQMLLISGAGVEYLTGAEEVLAPAGALADGVVAERDNRRAVTHCVALDLGRPALVVADGCCLLSLPRGPAPANLPRRALQEWEMVPLLSLLGRTSLRPAA
jgi:hypothetical protein